LEGLGEGEYADGAVKMGGTVDARGTVLATTTITMSVNIIPTSRPAKNEPTVFINIRK
jgi:hypothetical protein